MKRTLLIIGIVIGILIAYNIVTYLINPSSAYVKAQPVTQYLEARGAEKICDTDHKPSPPDDTTPYYAAYLYMDKASVTDQVIKDAAAEAGFTVTKVSQSYTAVWGRYKNAATEFTNRKGEPGSHEYVYGVDYDEINVAVIHDGTVADCSEAKATNDKFIIAVHTYIYK